jgi:hypothetical protein
LMRRNVGAQHAVPLQGYTRVKGMGASAFIQTQVGALRKILEISPQRSGIPLSYNGANLLHSTIGG